MSSVDEHAPSGDHAPGVWVSGVCTECGASIRYAPTREQVRCDYCGAGLAVQREGYLVRLACPACGGNFHFVDGSMAGSCPFCEVRLLALTRERLLRFVVEPDPARAPAPEPGATLVFAPFWRLSGLLFSWEVGTRRRLIAGADASATGAEGQGGSLPSVPRRVDDGPGKAFTGRVVDVHAPDPAARNLGLTSLRLRGALHPVVPFREEHERRGELAAPLLDVTNARESLYESAIDHAYSSQGLEVSCRRVDIAVETLSLLYYPFWFSALGAPRRAWDAVSGAEERLASSAPDPSGPDGAGRVSSAVFDELKLIELRCGACHSALAPSNRAVVFPCAACKTFWVAEREGLKPFEARLARPAHPLVPAESLMWLPFWRVGVELSYDRRRVATVDELHALLGTRRASLPANAQPGAAPLCYYAPAYGALRAPRVDHAARDLTRLQPRLEAGEHEAGETFHCFYAPDDARRLAYATWVQLLPGADARRIRSLRVRSAAVELWYLPFGKRERELRCLLSGRSYERSSFRGVGH